MRNLISILMLASVLVFSSCNKNDEIHNTETKVGISDVTVYPVLSMAGDRYVSIVLGGSFTDPGAKATEGGAEINVSTTGSVNANQPGLYVLTYSATNRDGFSVTTSRNVVVLSEHEAPGVDLSGKYDYVAGGTTSTVTKVAEGVYTTDNAWSAATTIPILFVSTDGLTISIPSQATPFGTAFGSGTYTPATRRLVYTISIPSQGIDNSNRNWQRQ